MDLPQIRIRNKERVLTKVFEKLWMADERFVINYGGTGSSKSFSAAQKEVLMTCDIKSKGRTTLVIRKVGNTLRDSVIPSFRNRIRELNLTALFTYNKTERELTNVATGSKIVFRGLDDPEKLKSFEGLQRVLVEEASELDFEDFTELNRRVRGIEDIQITLCFNPIHESHWLKLHFFDNEIPDCKVIHSTYKDNQFLTEKDREQIEQMKLYNYNQYRVYALGEWGITENKNPWLFSFDETKHTRKDIPYLPTFPVYLSFDFNREPVTCIASQMSPSKGLRDSFLHFIKEFGGNYQLKELCQRIKATYPAAIFFVTGDRTGKNGNVGFEERHATYYTMIQRYLGLSARQMHIDGKNMEHNDSRNLINTLLYNMPNIYISKEGCPNLIQDCMIAQVDENSSRPGVIKKDRDLFKMDYFDGFRYTFQTYYADYANKVYLLGK